MGSHERIIWQSNFQTNNSHVPYNIFCFEDCSFRLCVRLGSFRVCVCLQFFFLLFFFFLMLLHYYFMRILNIISMKTQKIYRENCDKVWEGSKMWWHIKRIERKTRVHDSIQHTYIFIYALRISYFIYLSICPSIYSLFITIFNW